MVVFIGNRFNYHYYELSKGDKINDKYFINENFPVGICPKCGKELVIKNGKFGLFVTCSNFKNGCKNTYNFNNFTIKSNIEVCETKSKGINQRTIKYKLYRRD